MLPARLLHTVNVALCLANAALWGLYTHNVTASVLWLVCALGALYATRKEDY